MSLYKYQETPEITIIVGKSKANTTKNKILTILSKLLIGSGMLIIAGVVWPILSYELFTAPQLERQDFISPVPVLGIEEEYISPANNFTYPNNWFPSAEYDVSDEREITQYYLSIPKFKIKDAIVKIGGEDLSNSLVQFPGTAIPGKLGVTVIFGHSILPQFFSPTNYLSIFSLIPTMQLGDDIFITYDGVTYTYRVIDKVEVKPTNLSVLDQSYDNEYLRLITCTPPGTYLKRGVITAMLVN